MTHTLAHREYLRQTAIDRNTKHGYAPRKNRPAEYNIWSLMRRRCQDPKNPDWYLYGGRGIKVYAPWNDFLTFFEYMGLRPSPKHSIDRWPDKNGNYEPGNVRWATPKEQGRNTRKNLLFEFQGKICTLSEIAELCSINYHTLHTRLTVQKLSLHEAVNKNVRCRSIHQANGFPAR